MIHAEVRVGFWRSLFGVARNDYELKALVSSRRLEPINKFGDGVHIFCDLDKTYLETEFESWIKMAKIPFESPHDKITVPGASEVLQLARWGGDPTRAQRPKAGLHFVSSSPPQLRLALDGKLTLDHLEWSSDTFKNQTYNLRMGRIDLLRDHIAYKTKAILDIATKLPDGSRVLMIGDNAEFDAFVYTGVRLFLERRISTGGLRDWLRGAKVEESVIAQVLGSDVQVANKITVGGIYIRSVPGYSGSPISRFDGTWFRFDHWAQVAWSLMKDGTIDPESLPLVIREFHNFHGVPMAHLRWCLHKVLSDDRLSEALRQASEVSVDGLGDVGASGTSRRILPWDFEMDAVRDIDAAGAIDPRQDASQWFQSIEDLRTERKRRRRR
jgi:hypothetical protein